MQETRDLKTYESEPVRIKNNSLQYACYLRGRIQTWQLTQEQAQKLLNNPLIVL